MSFARILRSSALMGGAQVVVLAAGFVRAKMVAVLLGASGVGLIGIFNAFSGNISAFAGWGLGTSGVRLIAGAEEGEKAVKVAAVRRMGWTLSLVGLGLGLLACYPATWATFTSAQYAKEMAVVALAVPCFVASSAWSAILQASGKIASLAKVQIAGALAGLLLGLPAIYFFGSLGIAASILLAAVVPAIVLWSAARSAYSDEVNATAQNTDIRYLVKLGGALMVVGWVGQLAAYAIRLAIVQQEGLDAAGLYQAAYSISGSLPGFVFAAMGADFFPRVAASKDEDESRDITEKQVRAGLLLGIPLIVAMLTLAKLSVRVLYTDTFDAAIPLITWMTWGVFVRLVAWPLGFWMMARRSPKVFVLTEVLASMVSLVLPVLLMSRMGLIGAAVGFFCAGIIYFLVLVWVLSRGTSTSNWSGTMKHALVAALVVGGCQWIGSLNDDLYFGIMPTVIATAGCFWCYRLNVTKEKLTRQS